MNRGAWKKGRILVLGAGGMLGQELVTTLQQHLDSPSEDRLIAWDLPELDICSKEDVLKNIICINPDLVIKYQLVDASPTTRSVCAARIV